MFSLKNFFNKGKINSVSLSMDEIAELLKTTPEALQEFEDSYHQNVLDDSQEDDLFQINSKQASKMRKQEMVPVSTDLDGLCRRIVDELLDQTVCFVYDGEKTYTRTFDCLADSHQTVTLDEVNQYPAELQPQLTGNYMRIDISEPSSRVLLYNYKEYLESKNAERKQTYYHMFRQGLDILDLDPLTYAILGRNKNAMGNWLPELVNACKGQDFFLIPKTTIVKVPITLLQLTRIGYEILTETSMKIVNQWAHDAFALDDNKEYFVKTGTYSSKFDFRNCLVKGPKEVQELGEYLLYIHFQALQMASPLTQPASIYGVSTTNEWVVREFIPDKEADPCIYKGLPLRTEYRAFLDCDTGNVLGVFPYWHPEVMKKRFRDGAGNGSLHDKHDYVIYKSHEERLRKRFEENKERVEKALEAIVPNLNLSGQWSLDIMQNGNDFYLIDMAEASNSALVEYLPKGIIKPAEDDWIPDISMENRKIPANWGE